VNIRIPPDIIKMLESETAGISHGSVTLTIHLRDYRPRFVISRERSLLADTISEVCESKDKK
jgi:hypothetical protein